MLMDKNVVTCKLSTSTGVTTTRELYNKSTINGDFIANCRVLSIIREISFSDLHFDTLLWNFSILYF